MCKGGLQNKVFVTLRTKLNASGKKAFKTGKVMKRTLLSHPLFFVWNRLYPAPTGSITPTSRLRGINEG